MKLTTPPWARSCCWSPRWPGCSSTGTRAARDARDYKRYEIYFEGSVSGLNRGSTVRYLGVDVGRVVAIRIDKRASDRVQVIADIDSQTPISKDTLASLSMQGVTGLLYIDLLANADAKRGMAPVPSEKYPVIDSVQSNFDRLLVEPARPGRPRHRGRRPRLARAVGREHQGVLEDHEEHRAERRRTLPGAMRDAAVVVAELKATLADVRAAAAGARQLIDTSGPNLAAASERMRAISENLAKTTANLDELMTDHREDLGLFLRDSLPEIERLLRDSRSAAQEFRELSRSLKADPSQLLYEPSYKRRGDSAMKRAFLALSLDALALGACGGVFESKLAAPQAYVLRLPPATGARRPSASCAAACCCSGRRPARASIPIASRCCAATSRFDFYAASRWAAPAPDLRRKRDASTRCAPPARSPRCSTMPRRTRRVYNLRCALRRFEADYTRTGGGAPTVYVALDCTLGRHRDRELLGELHRAGSAVAGEDRLSAVVAAFEAATATAMDANSGAIATAAAVRQRAGEADSESR